MFACTCVQRESREQEPCIRAYVWCGRDRMHARTREGADMSLCTYAQMCDRLYYHMCSDPPTSAIHRLLYTQTTSTSHTHTLLCTHTCIHTHNICSISDTCTHHNYQLLHAHAMTVVYTGQHLLSAHTQTRRNPDTHLLFVLLAVNQRCLTVGQFL